jgi:hypothetical protein
VRRHFEENRQQNFGTVKDGWTWQSLINVSSQENFGFSLDGVQTDSTAVFFTDAVMERNGSSTTTFRAQYSMNNTSFLNAQWTWTTQTSIGGSPVVQRAEGVALRNGTNTLNVLNTSSGVPGAGPSWAMDYFELFYRRRAEVGNEPLVWQIFVDEAADERWHYTFTDAGTALSNAYIYDLSDAWSPRRLVGASIGGGGAALDWEVDVDAGVRREFALYTDAQIRTPLSLARRRPRLLKAEVASLDGGAGDGYDMVVLHPAIFTDAAEELADLRRVDLGGLSAPRVTSVDLQDIYDQFGHGTKDPAAIRNYLKFLYEVDPRLLFAALLGDANRDARGVLPNSDPDRVPVYVQDYWPRTQEWGLQKIPFARDDWFGCLDDPPSGVTAQWLDLPDIAVGRLPASTVAEMDRLVGRIFDYETRPAPGTWRNTLLLAADDEVGLAGPYYRESEHTSEAECLAQSLLPLSLDVEKVYLTEYPLVDGAKPGGKQALRRGWSDGRLIVHYIGHGAPEQMADENLWRIEDVGSLTNADRLPLFLAFSCDVSIFDDPTKRSMAEALVLHEGGGSIASIAATQVTFIRPNENLTEAFYGRLLAGGTDLLRPGTKLRRANPLGLALMQAKWATPGSNDQFDQSNDAKYVLLGDPALRLQTPQEEASLSGALVEAIRSGREVEVTASLPGAFASSGNWYLEAKESADSVTFVMARQPAPPAAPLTEEDLPYVLDGSAFYRGQGSFSGGEFTTRLRTPTFLRFGQNGRVRVLMESGTEQFVGVAESVPVERASADSDDQTGPAITLRFEGDARRVQPGSVLEAVIEDPSGINILGTVPANSILVEFDQRGVLTDVTDEFRLDEGSFTRGTLDVALPETLEPGMHTLALSAGDMLSNRATVEIGFEVLASGDLDIGLHAPWPNPFADTTRFIIEVIAPATTGSDIEIDIYTVDGRLVRTLRERIDAGSGRLSLPWDGTDRRGDEVANGTYLYVLRVTFPTEPPLTQTSTGRVVKMR